MDDPRAVLERRLQVAFDAVTPGGEPSVRPSDRADFQANGALALAKKIGRNPKELAEQIVASIDLADVCESVEVSGPGFINLLLSSTYLASQVLAMAIDPRLGVPESDHPEVVVVDYSAPNVAKEMHVGHLRSTIIGDALCRLWTFMGNTVIRENHIGDWGTPFGMLIEHLLDLGEENAVHELSVGDLNAFYRQARASFDQDDGLKERSRNRVVLLQSGDEETLRLWRVLVAESVRYFDEVYSKLDVLLTDDDIVGESFYNPMLPGIVSGLAERGLLVDSDGAMCVFPPGFTNRNGDPLPLIVQKSGEGFGYAATDLAAICDRVSRLKATRLMYVVGSPQAQHLEMVFAVAAMAGWLVEPTRAVHVAFGSVLDSNRKMFRSREGENVKLVDLVDEAVARADAAVAERNPELPADERQAVARIVGVGAIKYADLSTDRTRDYVFDWERMLAFEGNTAPYLQYARARIRSIFRRGNIVLPEVPALPTWSEPSERALAAGLVGFGAALAATLDSSSPSKLCAYLFELASTFTTFYEKCPILQAPTAELRQSRLLLAELTGNVLECGLGLLGISCPEQM